MFDLPKQIAFNPNCSGHHIYSTDKNHITLGCNDWQAKDIGLSSSKDVIGKHIDDLYSKAESNIVIANNEDILRNGRANIFEEFAWPGDGQMVVYSTYKFPLKNEKNKIIGVMGITVPIEQVSPAAIIQKNTNTIPDLRCLSPQQLKCFYLLLKGCSAKGIAQEMRLSPRTIEYYITHIRLKLHCKSIRELVVRYANRQEMLI